VSVLAPKLRNWRTAPLAIFAIAAVILLGGVLVVLQNEGSYRTGRNQQALVQAEILAASVAAPLDFNDPVAAQQAVDAFRANKQTRWVGVYDRNGRAIAGYDRSGAPIPQTIAAIPPDSSAAVRVSTPVELSRQRIGTVYFEVDREVLGRRLARYVLLASLVVLAALVVTALGLAQRALHEANRQLLERADALAEANLLLEEQIVERAKAEGQLRQSQKMQALGQLTGGIAHDFNNLLTVIQGSADMLCRDELPESKRKRFANAIVQAASNAASLTSQLLAFARRQPLKPEKMDLNQLVLEMDDLINRTLGETIRVSLDLCGDGCTVEVDRAQLQSAILNIASNARDAMPQGGRLLLSTRVEDDAEHGRRIALEIADSGHGMDPETLERVFEPFFTTKVTGKGTGLGLSQVYGFASQSGGDVRITSEPGAGTRLTLVLPCCESSAAIEARGAIASTADMPPSAILVVEDNDEVAIFAETLLGELGHQVTLARSGEEALEFTRAREFDVVFSDVVMPGMGGLKLAEALAREKPELPVVLATGYSQEIAEAGSGGRPVILKPYRLATLSEALAAVLRSETD
jgi:signal transduction histidine kinase/CheY-like chemotaxis protein